MYSIVKRFHAIVPLYITVLKPGYYFFICARITERRLFVRERRLLNFSGCKCGAYSGRALNQAAALTRSFTVCICVLSENKIVLYCIL